MHSLKECGGKRCQRIEIRHEMIENRHGRKRDEAIQNRHGLKNGLRIDMRRDG